MMDNEYIDKDTAHEEQKKTRAKESEEESSREK